MLKLKFQYFGHLMQSAELLEKTLMLDNIKILKEKGMTEDEIQHHRLNGHEFELTQRDSGGQRTLACCSPWGHRELDTTYDWTMTTYRYQYLDIYLHKWQAKELSVRTAEAGICQDPRPPPNGSWVSCRGDISLKYLYTLAAEASHS